MKPALLTIFVTTLFACVNMEKQSKADVDLHRQITEGTLSYDSLFAHKLDADQFGMKAYVMAFLKRGPNRSQDSLAALNLQKAHLENINRLANEGKLILAGPFMDDQNIRGIYIFNVETIEEAKKLTETDPAIQAGRLEMELHPWYGSAVLPLIVPLSKRVEKTNVANQ